VLLLYSPCPSIITQAVCQHTLPNIHTFEF